MGVTWWDLCFRKPGSETAVNVFWRSSHITGQTGTWTSAWQLEWIHSPTQLLRHRPASKSVIYPPITNLHLPTHPFSPTHPSTHLPNYLPTQSTSHLSDHWNPITHLPTKAANNPFIIKLLLCPRLLGQLLGILWMDWVTLSFAKASPFQCFWRLQSSWRVRHENPTNGCLVRG